MDSFTRLLAVTAEFFGRLGARAIFFIVLYGAIFCIQIMRLNLLDQPTVTFLTCAAAWLAVCLLSIAGTRHPAFWIPAGLLFWFAIKGTVPDVARGAEILVAAGEERFERKAIEMTQDIPEKVTCNELTYPHQTFFRRDPVTEETKAVLHYSEDDGYIVCWDRPGVHPRIGQPLKEITRAVVERIRHQPTPARTPRTLSPQIGFRPVVERNASFSLDGFVPVVEKRPAPHH